MKYDLHSQWVCSALVGLNAAMPVYFGLNNLQVSAQISKHGGWREEKTHGPIRLCIVNFNAQHTLAAGHGTADRQTPRLC